MFKRKLTRWIQLGTFEFARIEYMVFVRGNKKNGMLYFKTKRVNGFWNNLVQPIGVAQLVDIKKQWAELENQINNK